MTPEEREQVQRKADRLRQLVAEGETYLALLIETVDQLDSMAETQAERDIVTQMRARVDHGRDATADLSLWLAYLEHSLAIE